MADYNPNSVWASKKQPLRYSPPAKTEPSRTPEGGDAQRNYIWWWAGGLFAVVVALGILFIVYRPAAGPNVSIGFVKPDQVLVGDPFPLTITFSNYSQNILKNAVLTLTLPDGLAFVGQSPGQRSLGGQSLGDIGPGSVYKFNGDSNDDLVAVGNLNAGTLEHVDAVLSYSTDASPNNTFKSTGGVDIYIQGPAFSVNVNPPAAVLSGQNFDFTVSYVNNSHHDFSDAALAFQYPPSFTYISSNAKPSGAGNAAWDLGAVAAGGSGTLTITGNVVGPQSASYPLAAKLSGVIEGNTYTLANGTANVAVAASPLSLTVVPNNNPDYVAAPGDSVDYVLTYTNTSGVTFQNVTLTAALAGTMFDLTSVQTGGSFSSINNTVTWNPASVPALASVAPGQSGSVDFKVRLKGAYPAQHSYDKNFLLDVNAQIVSPTVPPGTAASSTMSAAKAENKVGGNLTFVTKALWRDAASGILNNGPYPPKVNKPTQYTIHWIITNYATDMGNVTLTAALQSGTTCTGTVKSNMSTAPVCDPASGAVTWTIPTVPATMGIVGPAAEAIFQVTNTPAVNQVGSPVTLMGATSLQATDLFTSSTITQTAPPVTTALPDDVTIVGGNGGAVVQ